MPGIMATTGHTNPRASGVTTALWSGLVLALGSVACGDTHSEITPGTAPGTGAAARLAGGVAGAPPWPTEALLIVDMDAGEADDQGLDPRGVVFVSFPIEPADGEAPRWSAPRVLARDARWREPVDVLVLDDGSLLVLDAAYAGPWNGPSGDPDRRGALFLVSARSIAGALTNGSIVERSSMHGITPDTRQPVALAFGRDGEVLIVDRAADPSGLGRPTGAVFVRRGQGADASDATDGVAPSTLTTALVQGPELVTPGCALLTSDDRLLVLDADANPHGVFDAQGRPGTPGVLFVFADGELQAWIEPGGTTSPVGLVERRPGELFLVDANHSSDPDTLYDGAVLRIDGNRLTVVVGATSARPARTLIDPRGVDVLPDGRLVLADANADPLELGADGVGRAVGRLAGRGALLAVDPDAGTVDVLLADAAFVNPAAVRVVSP